MDGVMENEGFELKTINKFSFDKIPNGAPDDTSVIGWLKEKHPKYVAQAFEYDRMLSIGNKEIRGQRFVFINPSYPFPMREIFLPYDERAATEVRDKYVRVIQNVADQRMPPPCCAPRSKESQSCPIRSCCPIAQS